MKQVGKAARKNFPVSKLVTKLKGEKMARNVKLIRRIQNSDPGRRGG